MGIAKFTLGTIESMFGKPKYTLPNSLKPGFSVKGYQKHLEQVSEDIAEAFLQFLKSAIESNTYGFKDDPKTVAMKSGSIPWIDTKELINALERQGYFVMFKSGNHKGGLSYEHLAMILEYGMKEKGIPPRPVFRKSFEDFQSIAEDMFMEGARPYYSNL